MTIKNVKKHTKPQDKEEFLKSLKMYQNKK